MEGVSGSYAFNGTNLTLQPTEGHWSVREVLGVDGAGHPIYPAVREFIMTFDLTSPTDWKQLNDAYKAVSNSGTVVACLPEYGNTDYSFRNYSGTTLQEPEAGAYFETYIQNASLTILNIRT